MLRVRFERGRVCVCVREREYETMSITGGPGRGPLTDFAPPYVGGTLARSNDGSAGDDEAPDRRCLESSSSSSLLAEVDTTLLTCTVA